MFYVTNNVWPSNVNSNQTFVFKEYMCSKCYLERSSFLQSPSPTMIRVMNVRKGKVSCLVVVKSVRKLYTMLSERSTRNCSPVPLTRQPSKKRKLSANKMLMLLIRQPNGQLRWMEAAKWIGMNCLFRAKHYPWMTRHSCHIPGHCARKAGWMNGGWLDGWMDGWIVLCLPFIGLTCCYCCHYTIPSSLWWQPQIKSFPLWLIKVV